MNTTPGPFRLDAANLSEQEREDARTSVQVTLGALDAYRAMGSPHGHTLAGFERWVRDVDKDLEKKKDAAAPQTLSE